MLELLALVDNVVVLFVVKIVVVVAVVVVVVEVVVVVVEVVVGLVSLSTNSGLITFLGTQAKVVLM